MSPSRRTRPSAPAVARGLVLGLGAAAVAPAAAQADPDPDTPPPSGPSLSKLDPGDQALARRARSDATPPVATQPSPAPASNPGTPPGDRTGDATDYPSRTPSPPARLAPPRTKPAPVRPRVQRIGRGDIDPPAAASTPATSTPEPRAKRKPKPKPKQRAQPEPRQRTTPAAVPPGDRTGDAADYPSSPAATPPASVPTTNGQLPPPRIQRMGRGDMGPDRYAPVIDNGSTPNLDPQAPPPGLSYPGQGGRVSVTTGCNASGPSSRGVKVSCVPSGGRPEGGYKGTHRPRPPRAGVTIGGSHTTTAGRTPNTMTKDGERASLTITTDTMLTIGGEAQLKKLKVSYKRIARGNRIVYQITGTPSRIDAIAKNPKLAPNANDPRTIQPGDGVVLNDERYTGSEGKAGGYGVQAERTKHEGDRQSAGVQRTRDGKILITVGDDRFVRTLMKLGVGNDVAGVGLSDTSDSAKGQVRQVELDVTTKQGWDAYQRFIATGRVDWYPGMKYSVSDRETWDTTRGAYGKLGPVEVGTTGTHQTGDLRRVSHSDGSTEYVTTTSSNKVTFERSVTTNRDGTKGPSHAYLLVENVPSSEARDYRDRTGGAGPVDGDGSDVRIEFSDRDLDALRELAIRRIQRVTGDLSGDTPTRKQILDGSSAAHPDLTPVYVEWQIVKAKTPTERLYALYQGQSGRNDLLLKTLRDDGGDGETPLPGRAVVLDD